MNDSKDVVEKLEKIIRLLAMTAVQGRRQKEQIEILSQAGFEPREIADLLGTTSNTVRVALVSIRKGRKQTTRSVGKEQTDVVQETQKGTA
jgi:DNA-directed RNA polymerase specialized sigma24 family protein